MVSSFFSFVVSVDFRFNNITVVCFYLIITLSNCFIISYTEKLIAGVFF